MAHVAAKPLLLLFYYNITIRLTKQRRLKRADFRSEFTKTDLNIVRKYSTFENGPAQEEITSLSVQNGRLLVTKLKGRVVYVYSANSTLEAMVSEFNSSSSISIIKDAQWLSNNRIACLTLNAVTAIALSSHKITAVMSTWICAAFSVSANDSIYVWAQETYVSEQSIFRSDNAGVSWAIITKLAQSHFDNQPPLPVLTSGEREDAEAMWLFIDDAYPVQKANLYTFHTNQSSSTNRSVVPLQLPVRLTTLDSLPLNIDYRVHKLAWDGSSTLLLTNGGNGSVYMFHFNTNDETYGNGTLLLSTADILYRGDGPYGIAVDSEHDILYVGLGYGIVVLYDLIYESV